MAGKKTGKRLLTWVLVLVMALSLLPLNALAANRPETDSSSGMNFTKELLPNQPDDDGNYTIRMTAQATGTTTTKVEPMDIVLVLDQSGSMADDFSNGTRQSAMIAAVNSFIGKVADKYSTDADHRMAIVTFGYDAGELVRWTAVDSTGAAALTNAISNLPENPSGATNVGAGMQMAKNLMNDANTGNNTDRQKTVIVFTDGVPTTETDFSITVANTAIDAAKSMKNSGVTIYTVGIFNGAKPTQLHGDKWNYEIFEDVVCDGSVGSCWGGSWLSDLFVGNDFDSIDVPAGNRFLNYLSSNSKNASEVGITKGTYHPGHTGIAGGTGWRIDKNADWSNQSYYMTASDASSLEKIFEGISSTVPAPVNDKLDEKTVITDTLSDYFTFARTEDGKVDVKVYAEKPDRTTRDIDLPNGPNGIDVKDETVTVTGYDFSKHYQGIGGVAEEKLVIEIKVKPDPAATWGPSDKYETNKDNATVTLPNSEANPIAKAESPKAHVDTYQVTYTFDDTAPDGVNPPEDPKYYISGQQADVKQPEESSVNAGDYTYTFNGWKNGNEDVNGETIPISGNVTLTGSWSQTANTASYTVNYLWNGEQIQAPTTGDNAMHGDKITITDASIDGYTLIPGQQTSMTIGTGENVLNLNYYKNVTLTANSDTVTYDGKEHTVTGYTSAPEGVTFESVSASGTGTDAGEYDVKFVGESVVDTYNDLYIVTAANSGTLTINKRSVTLTSETASKAYDGTPLTRPNVTVGGDGFVKGEVTDIKATGSVTHVSEGEVTNTIEYTPTDKFKANNYDITKTEGKLTITEASAPTPGTFDFNDVVYGDGKVTPAITKTVKGNVGRNFKETFYVTVKGADETSKDTMSAAFYTGKAEVIASKSLKDVPFLFKPEVMANAVVPYGELRFTEAGTYTYTVREDPGGTSRMSYDTTEYTLTIKVVLDADSNTYQVKSWQFTPGNRENLTQLNIVNTYRTYHPSAPSKPTLNTGDHYAYVMGYPDGTVRPNGSITRAEVSAILFRLLSDKTRDEYFTTESSFTDVKAGAWYNNSIATLEKAGVIVDTAKGGAFRPNEAITRAELAAMLAQFSDAKPVKGVKFSDVSAEHWAYEAIAIAAKMGWIEGYPDGTFRPDATITRAEMMTLVNRALERVPSDEDHLLSKRVMLTFPDCKSGDWFYIAVQEATNSHTYERAATEKNGDEQWTALRANRDWTLLEK